MGAENRQPADTVCIVTDGSGDLVLDHVLVAVEDLDRAEERLWNEHGLACAQGGRHLEMGTANRLVPLGSAYLELLVIVDESDSVPNPYFRDRIRQVRASGSRPFAYVVRGTRDGVFDATAHKLGLTPFPTSRTRPDGSVVTWHLIGMIEALLDPTVPAVIQWEPGDNPGEIPVSHAVSPNGIVGLEIRCPDAALPEWVRPHPGLPLAPIDATPLGPGEIVIGLEDDGKIVLDDVLWGSRA
jgi:Glyoxalase-like domain